MTGMAPPPAPSTTRRRITVLGAGVAGLAAAHLLARGGHEVELVDAEFTAPGVGTTLGLFPPAQRVLERIGVLEAVREEAAAPREGRLVAADGRVLARVPAGGVLLASRTVLNEAMLASLPASVRCRRRQVSDVRPLLDGTEILVAADGVRSLTRSSGWGARARARRHGQTVLRGTTTAPPPDVSETWGRGWLFGITPLRDGGTNWFASLPEHREPDTSRALAHARRTLGGIRPEIDAVLAAATPERTLVQGILTAPPVWPARGRVVLIGDAAHAMAPNLGHGANTALADAGALADVLASSSGPAEAALQRYARRRHLPDQGWRVASQLMMAAATWTLIAPTRDAVLRAMRPLLLR